MPHSTLKLDFSWVEGDGNSISNTSLIFCRTLQSGFHKCILAFNLFLKGVTTCSAPSKQHSGSILGCLGSICTFIETLFPMAILLMESAFVGFSGSNTHVCSSISSSTDQNSDRASTFNRNWLWTLAKVLWEFHVMTNGTGRSAENSGASVGY